MDDSLIDSGILDSFAIIDLVSFLEGKFEIRFSDDEISREVFGSINTVVDHIMQKIASR